MSALAAAAEPAVCFRTGRPADIGVPAVLTRLGGASAQALAELMPVLICGEESAMLVFDHFARAAPAPADAAPGAARATLRQVAEDETRHERLLQALRRGLPPAEREAEAVAGIRRFFKATADRSIGRHFTRIAALDSGFCSVLAMIRSRGSRVAADRGVDTVLASIHRDESRHVSTAMAFVRELALPAERRSVVAEMRQRFAGLLMLRADCFEVLGVDPDRLRARIVAPPAFLLR